MDDLDEMEINNNKISQSTKNQQKGNDKQTKQDDNSSKIPGHDKTGSESHTCYPLGTARGEISPLPTLLRGKFCASPLNAQNCTL